MHTGLVLGMPRRGANLILLALLGALAIPVTAKAEVVDAGGQGQWISCIGTGSPTAVLINGLRSDHTTWSAVRTRLARTTRVCVTDRPGVGLSPERRGAQRTDAGAQARELRAALAAVGERGSLILVAHSYGGLIARAFAVQFPEQVAGVMLVEAVYPGVHRTFLPSYRGDWREGGTTIDMDASERAARSGSGLAHTPLLVIVAGDPQNGTAWADRRWNREQARAARLSRTSDLWVARKSGHSVQVDQPEIVVAGLRWLLARASRVP